MASVLEALNFNFSTFLLQSINILVVMAVLYKLLFKPLMRIIEERDRKIQKDIEEARSAREEAQEVLSRYRAQLEQAKEEANRIVENAKKSGEETRQRLISEAREEAERNLEKAKREIENEKLKALQEIRSEAATLAVLAASKVIRKEINPEDHKKLVEEFVEEVGEVQ